MKVTVRADVGSTIVFPRYCSMCLKPFPDRKYKIGKSEIPWTSTTITTYSIDVPICTECYETGGSPVQLKDFKDVPSEATFWFARQQYGEMFTRANAGIVITSIVTPDEPIPGRPHRLTRRSLSLSGIVGKTKMAVGFAFGVGMLFGGTMSLSAYVMYGQLFNLTGGFGLMLSGVLDLLGGFSLYRGNQKRGNLLIVGGFILLILVVAYLWLLIPPEVT